MAVSRFPHIDVAGDVTASDTDAAGDVAAPAVDAAGGVTICCMIGPRSPDLNDWIGNQ